MIEIFIAIGVFLCALGVFFLCVLGTLMFSVWAEHIQKIRGMESKNDLP